MRAPSRCCVPCRSISAPSRKGFAIDLAGKELDDLPGFVINAGGDILARGLNPDGEPWRIGIRHPRRHAELLTSLRITDAAVCTSGDYERSRPRRRGHHILNPVGGGSASADDKRHRYRADRRWWQTPCRRPSSSSGRRPASTC